MIGLVIALATLGDEGRRRPIDFDTEVVPVLTRAGCNAGACHGAAAGRGGLRLSLLGGDPAFDYDAVVHDLEGRRVDLARPGRSLLLGKATGRLDHGGGTRLARDGPGAGRLLDWIGEGARRLRSRRLAGLEAEPARAVVAVGDVIPLRTRARFDDGTAEDVTRWTVFTPVDPSAVAAECSADSASVVVRRGGQGVVVARFLDRVLPVQLIAPLGEAPVDLDDQPRANSIDDAVLDMLATLRLTPAPAADDATFLRRARLDLTGRLPDPEEVRAFLADRGPEKRPRLVDRLLASGDFVDYWTYRLAALLRVGARGGDQEGARAFHAWLREQVARNAPLDATARALLTATGDTRRDGPANFHLAAVDARAEAELVARVFLGARLGCANCHDHPLDRWTQDDFHGLAAVFARLERGREVRLLPRGEVTHPRTGEPARPKLPGGPFLDPAADNRPALADWLAGPARADFARAAVNRLWKALMGRGLVEPADDLRATNPATHPALLDALAADFAGHGCDVRRTLRLIATSAAYARGPAPGGGGAVDDRFLAHAPTRPLAPAVLADALADVTGVPDRYGDLPPGTRAIALVDPRTPSEALDALGRCTGTDSCEATGPAGGGLSAKLHLLNGRTVNGKLAAPEGRLHRLIAEGRPGEAILAEFYLRALGRPPSGRERDFWARALGDASTPDGRAAMLEDAVWGLLNSREFLTNH